LLVLVPLGGPTLLVLVIWILDGFQGSTGEKGETSQTVSDKPQTRWWRARRTLQSAAPSVNYHAVIARAVSEWDYDTSLAKQAREIIYKRAKLRVGFELHAQNSPELDISQQLRLLDEAIKKVELAPRRRARIAQKGSTALLVFTAIVLPRIWAIDFTSMSIYWVARLPKDLLDKR
jgi:hypothetical protein